MWLLRVILKLDVMHQVINFKLLVYTTETRVYRIATLCDLMGDPKTSIFKIRMQCTESSNLKSVYLQTDPFHFGSRPLHVSLLPYYLRNRGQFAFDFALKCVSNAELVLQILSIDINFPVFVIFQAVCSPMKRKSRKNELNEIKKKRNNERETRIPCHAHTKIHTHAVSSFPSKCSREVHDYKDTKTHTLTHTPLRLTYPI